jgi:hypothetical protein
MVLGLMCHHVWSFLMLFMFVLTPFMVYVVVGSNSLCCVFDGVRK